MNCIVCGVDNHKEFFRNPFGFSVTSDCRIFPKVKIVEQCLACGHLFTVADKQYLNHVGEIYRTYDSFAISGGQEQQLFAGKMPVSRSLQILKNIEASVAELRQRRGATLRILDVGTGDGVFLKACKKLFPDAQLFGHDVSSHKSGQLEREIGLQAFYSGGISEISGQFDLISMIHVAEHIPDLQIQLGSLRSRLSDGGLLLIQVPNIAKNFYDIFVYDHVSHFTKETMENLLTGVFGTTQPGIPQLGKEVTVLGGRESRGLGRPDQKSPSKAGGLEGFYEHLERLSKLSQSNESFGIFGTAIAGTFLAKLLGNRAAFFVDEDSARWGKQHLQLNVLPPDQVKAGSVVLAPFDSQVVSQLSQRLTQFEIRPI